MNDIAMPADTSAIQRYTWLLLFTAGIGGLLYGIDLGIISPALPYLSLTIDLTEQELSFIVAAVLAGSAVSSVVAGALADWFGRKKMMIASALVFVLSVAIIFVSNSYLPLLFGRLLQGASGGFIAVVVPLYLAECLPAASRGRGTSLFQLLLTIGIAAAALTGAYYINQADVAIKAAGDDHVVVVAAADHAWRSMFLCVMWPGLVFLVGTFALAESPRWLFRRGRLDAARAALLKSCTAAETELELREMAEHSDRKTPSGGSAQGSLLQRKYIIPFVLACVVLGCTQATGISSILAFMGVIFRKSGLDSSFAASMDFGVKVLNVLVTVIAVSLVDRMGRKFLLKTGTAVIIVALLTGAGVFASFESKRIEVTEKVAAVLKDQAIELPLASLGTTGGGAAMELAVLYRQGDKEAVLSAFSNDKTPVLKIDAVKDAKTGAVLPLEIKRAKYGPVPTKQTGYAVVAALVLFIVGFALGPGVCVWLALSELMPTRIRSMGMGIALLINQGVSTAIAAFFLPIVGNFGYSAMFAFWAGCTVVYFITAAFFLPETKGRSLEEIEEYFEGGKQHA